MSKLAQMCPLTLTNTDANPNSASADPPHLDTTRRHTGTATAMQLLY